MRLYLLERVDETDRDQCDGFVVRASSESEARFIASLAHGDEGETPWLTTATCRELTGDGDRGVVLGSFNAG